MWPVLKIKEDNPHITSYWNISIGNISETEWWFVCSGSIVNDHSRSFCLNSEIEWRFVWSGSVGYALKSQLQQVRKSFCSWVAPGRSAGWHRGAISRKEAVATDSLRLGAALGRRPVGRSSLVQIFWKNMFLKNIWLVLCSFLNIGYI
jgi:hypothetical protein